MENTLKEDLKQAQLARDETKVSTLRLLISEINNEKIKKVVSDGRQGSELSEAEIQTVVSRELKKRKEAALGFRQGGREEAALKEDSEAKILESYLPEQLSDEELTNLVDLSINEVGAKSISDMGKVIGMVMSKAQGKAEGGRVSLLVKERLSS